jgi:hypothetical protein
MNDTMLRKKLIRLAHANPELRPEILPLLETSRTAGDLANALLSRGRIWPGTDGPSEAAAHAARQLALSWEQAGRPDSRTVQNDIKQAVRLLQKWGDTISKLI